MQPAKEVTETAVSDLATLLDARDDAAVTLVAGETRLLAHRDVLVARSPVFAAMMQHDTLEASSGQVTITDVEGPVLRMLLAFMYTLQLPQLPDLAAGLLAATDKYDLPALKAHCEQQLVGLLDVESAVAAGVLALRHGCASLSQAAVSFTKAHTHQVMATKGWTDAVANDPQTFVEFSQLIAEPAAGSCSPAAGGSRRQPHSTHGPTPDSAAAPTAGDAVARLRSLSAKKKARRLIEAAEQGAVGEVAALLSAGADVGAVDGARMTALHWAAIAGHLEVARCLLGAGADVGARNCVQWTPLHFAAMQGHTSIVRLLLAGSAEPDDRDDSGRTPLHWAAQGGHTEAAAALLEAGADRGVRTNRGETPLDVARRNNKQQMVALLS